MGFGRRHLVLILNHHTLTVIYMLHRPFWGEREGGTEREKERERERERESERERVRVCVYVREGECMCEREREREVCT